MTDEENTTNTGGIPPRPLSRLSYLIMGLNLIAVIVLVGGIFYLDQFKRDLTNAETEILATEVQLYASLISDNAVSNGRFDLKVTQDLLDTFGEQKIQRIRLFSHTGNLLFDTKTVDRAPPANIEQIISGPIGRAIDKIFAKIVSFFSVTFKLPAYPEPASDHVTGFQDAPDALEGDLSLSAWQAPDGGLILSSAVPIRKNENIIGALLVTRGDTKIERSFSAMRLDILRFFFGALLVTLTFSLYLSSLIGHPLRQLAGAAQAIRAGSRDTDLIPVLSARKDEIGELSIAFREMAEALQDRINSIERFAADVAHELKNPLTSMRSAVETLDKVYREEDRKKLMSIIMHDLLRMDRLISDISKASRLDVELLRDVHAPVDLGNIILPLIDAYREPLERNSDLENFPHNIGCTGFEKPVLVIGQPVRLSQVFQNLLENALSFSPSDKEVSVSVREDKSFVSVTIDDFGPGIPPSRLEKIFERFYTERPGAEAFGGHSGLGLSIARQIIEAHDGTLLAENRKDETGNIIGARFIVKLKAA